MESKKPTLHVFGGGELVKDCETIALKNGWEVVLRTGERFVSSFPAMLDSTKVLIGNSLKNLMEEGGLPNDSDIGISLSAPWVIPTSIIDLFDGRLFNLHHAPLPKFRGAGGSCWRIMMGDRRGGVCIHELVPGIDAGDILAKVDFDFPADLQFPGDYDSYIFKHAKKLFIKWLSAALSGDISSTKQNAKPQVGEGEYWPRLHTDTHGWVNWSWSIDEIISFCHAFSYPYSGASTMIQNNLIRIKKLSREVKPHKFHPFQTGLIFRKDSERVWVAHPDGALILEDFQIEQDSVKLRLGDRLYSPVEKLELALKTRIQYKPDGKVFEN